MEYDEYLAFIGYLGGMNIPIVEPSHKSIPSG